MRAPRLRGGVSSSAFPDRRRVRPGGVHRKLVSCIRRPHRPKARAATDATFGVRAWVSSSNYPATRRMSESGADQHPEPFLLPFESRTKALGDRWTFSFFL